MSASFDYDPPPPVLSEPAVRVAVFRYDGEGGFEEMPNVQVVEVQQREGLEPMTARLSYIVDDNAIAQGWPTEFEHIMALAYAVSSASGSNNRKDKPDVARYVLRPDERIVIKVTDQFDVTDVIFDGYCQAPQCNVEPRSQSVTFVAVGVPIRLFDRPLLERRQAWSALELDEPPSKDGRQRVVQVAARFNPNGVPNCTPAGLWYSEDGDPNDSEAYPIFYDGGAEKAVPWTLARAARYLISECLESGELVEAPDLAVLDRLLNRRMPKKQDEDAPPDPNLFYDPDDPATYKESPIVLRDFDASGMRWAEALDRLLTFSGFASKFTTEGDEDGLPTTYIEVYRKDNGGPADPKSVTLQPRRLDVDPARSNVRSMAVVRDYKNAFNAVAMDAHPALVEVSVVLAMRGPIESSDVAAASDFLKSKITDEESRTARAYRMWYADELGEGHVGADGELHDSAFDFAPAFALIDDSEPLRRRRPGQGKLVTKGEDGEPLEKRLYISRDYEGATGVLWDGTGSWEELKYHWKLLDDRLGVWLDAEDLEKFPIGKEGNSQSGGKKTIKIITSMAEPDDDNPMIFLRLDTVIEADVRGFDDFDPRKASILKWGRYRYLDAKGAFRRRLVHESSPNYSGDPDEGEGLEDDGDDVKDAYSWMGQAQRAGEDPSVSGPIVIPWFTTAYKVGDRIEKVDGRELSLQVNQGAGQGEAKAFPFVVGVSYGFDGSQETRLEISDFRAMPDDPRSKRK